MTAQQPEILIINGKKMFMPTELSLNGLAEPGMEICTCCWRGYVGVWEIKDDKLYLNNVEHAYVKQECPIFADWISGELRVWSGNLLHYIHMGWSSTYEEDIYFTVENGIITDSRTESNIESFMSRAFQEISEATNKSTISFLYSIYLDSRGDLSRLIDKSTDRKQKYIDFQKCLDYEFKRKIAELAKDPSSGIVVVYKE